MLPAVLLLAAILWQLALAGESAWLCANAARVAARARAVGRSPEEAARSALPATLERGLRVSELDGGTVRVRMRMPLLLRSWSSPLTVAATAGLRGGA